MVLYSSQVQQQIMMQQMAASQQMQSAQQMSQAFGTAPHMAALQQGMGGQYGEQAAMRMAGMGRTAAGIGGMGLGIAGMFTGMPLDPFSGAMAAGRVGYGMAGLGGAALGAAAGIAPFYMASQAAQVYGGAFSSGMQQQGAINQTMRQNFNFSGGQGAFGRGFSQAQMGSIGQMVSSEAKQSPFTSSQELNSLISGGSEAGMFTAVRDVQQFSQRFKTMIDGLRKIQKELGGTLSEAMSFTRGSQQLGIFSSGSRTAFASDMRDTMATTGMSQDQLFGLAAQGSMLSRATGGVGRQGAVGALKMARSLGSALSSGVINQEALSEATGGLTGTDAIQAFTGRMLQQTERFSRRGMGRFSIFALSNEDATGLDGGQVDRFLAGDISTSSVSRDAHRNVGRMGRAKAVNREGMLRGSLMEQGGLAGQIGMMRLMVGDKVMDQGDDMASLVMQRRFGMGRSESELMTSLIRNQGTIARTEGVERAASSREMKLRGDISENRSMDAFMEHLQHGVQDATGVSRVREMGRNFMTKISGLAERAMNDVLGIQASTLSTADNMSIQRLAMGQATSDDVERLRFSKSGGGGSPQDAFSKPLAQRALAAMGFHSASSVGETMEARGVNLRNMSTSQRDTAIRGAEMAAQGRVAPNSLDQADLDRLMGDKGGTLKKLLSAELMASARGESGKVYGSFGESANALDAFRKKMGISGALTPNTASMLNAGSDGFMGHIGGGAAAGAGMSGLLGLLSGGVVGGLAGVLGGAVGGGAHAAIQGTEQDQAIDFLASGGEFAKRAREIGDATAGVTRLGGKAGKALRNASARSGISFEEAEAMRNYKGVDSEKMRGVLGSEDFQQSLRRLDGMQGNEKGMNAELQNMRLEAMRMSGPQKEAAMLAVRELEYNIQNTGGIGDKFRGAIQADKRDIELRRRFDEIGSQYNEAAGNATGELKEQLGKISGQFYNYDSADSIRSSVGDLQSKLAKMDPNSAEYREMAGQLGSSALGRGLLMGGAGERAFTRDAQGKGRRGRKGQADTVLGALTGNAIGEMEFSLGGHKVSSRNQSQLIFESFRKGGKDADEFEAQLTTQLTELIGAGATDKVKELRKLVHGGVDPKEAEEIYKKFDNDPALQRVRKEGIQRLQESRDPLGVERNNLLGEIRTGINRMVDRGGSNSGIPWSE